MREIKTIILAALVMFATSSLLAQPNWKVDNPAQYQYSMTVLCQLFIDKEMSTNPNDLIAAFYGDECRAVASPDGSGKVYLTVRSNSASGERITFKIWDSQNGREHLLSQTLNFEDNATYGDLQTPIPFHTNIKNYRLKAFNVISPNGDGINDQWVVDAGDLSLVTDLQLVIFSVNGSEVYKHSEKGYDNSWGGTSKNGNELPTGTYIYQFLDKDNKPMFRGSITIVR